MKKVLLTIAGILALTSTNAQNNETTGKWHTGQNKESGEIYSYTRGVGIKNHGGKKIDLTLIISNSEGGGLSFQLDNEALYKYNEGKNYLEINIIIDNGEKIQFYGKISDNGYPIITSRKDGMKLSTLINKMKSGNNIFVQTIGAGEPKVFKFPLAGFTAATKKIDILFEARKDPFTAQVDDEDPF